jgi:glycosyltransferase involved in cell wall biosynthesis
MILLVGNFLSASIGVRGMCEELAEKLRRAGYQVITTSSQKNRLLRLVDMLWTTWHQRHFYTVAQVEVYSGNAFYWSYSVCWLLRRIHKPYVLVLHGGNLPVFARKQPKLVSRLLQSAQIVTTPSKYLYEQMKTYRDDLRIIPNPIELANYPFMLRATPAPHLIWLRAFHQIYNPIMAPEAIAQLVDHFSDVALLMIGPDKGDGSLKQTQIRTHVLGLGEHVDFVGRIPKQDVPAWLNKGDIFINTTNIDNTPVSIIEAMACGLCIVSTDVGGIPYLLSDGEDALLVPPDDASAMAAAVERFLSEPDLARRLSANARKKAETFDWSIVLPQWKRVFSQLVVREDELSRTV